MNADYASVTDQSGIFAGSGGFDITVGNHTQLNGGVIASGATSDKNRLDTGTLGWNDIRNKADYSVESSSASMSSSGNTASQFMGNMANGMLAGLNNDASAASTTGSAVADGTIVIRDKEKQTQDVAELSRDTDNAHSTLAPIFDAAKEQQRIDENRAIAQIGSQVADIVRTEGKIAAQEAAKNPDNLAAAKAALEAEGKTPTGEDIARRAYDTALNDYGTGSDKQKAVQAITAAIQGLTGGDWGSAVAGAAAPYMAEYIKTHTAEGAERIISHALAGAVVADMQGGNAAAGAAGAGLSAAGAKYIAEALYPGKDIKNLSEEEKQGVVALATLASGIAGGVVGGEVSSGIDGAKSGQNEVSNNMFTIVQLQNMMIANNIAAAGGTESVRSANQEAALALDKAVTEFGQDAVKQCLSGGSCPMEAAFALHLIAGMLNSDADSTPNIGKDLTDADKAELGGTGSGTPGGWGPEDEENARNQQSNISKNNFDDKFKKEDLISSANEPINEQGLSAAARAWEKHAGRSGGTFDPLKGNVTQKNEAATQFVNEVLNNGNTVRTELSRGGVEYRLPDGKGVRYNSDGSFSGFLDPKR
jgi:filamentous hemagglutinin